MKFMLWLVVLIVFLGLVAGFILGKYTKEELKYKRYFNLLKRLLLFVLVIALLYYAWEFYAVFAFVVGVLVSFLIRKLYLYFGLALFLSFLMSKEFILLIASLIFIYGLVYGSFLRKKKLFIYNLILFLAPFLLFFAKDFVLNYLYLFLAFTSGALFKAMISKDLV